MKWFLLAGACAGVFIHASAAPVSPEQPAPQQTIGELAIARYQTADRGYQIAMAGHQPNEAPGYDALDWLRRRLKARLEVVEPKPDRVAFLKDYVEQFKKQEAFEEKMVAQRLSGAEQLLRVRYDRLDAEILLRQIEAK